MSNAYSERHLKLVRMTEKLQAIKDRLEQCSRSTVPMSPGELEEELGGSRFVSKEEVMAEFYVHQGYLSMLADLREIVGLPKLHYRCFGPNGCGCASAAYLGCVVSKEGELCSLCLAAENKTEQAGNTAEGEKPCQR